MVSKLMVGRPSPGFIMSVIIAALLIATSVVVYAVQAASLATPEARKSRPEFGTYPPDCGHLYDKSDHDPWYDCMGVGYK